MELRWLLPPPSDQKLVNELTQALKVPPIIAQILINRRITTPEESKEFLRSSLDQLHDPFAMKEMDEAVGRICRAIDEGQKVMVYGDYDVDGITGVSMLLLILNRLGAKTCFYIPDRLREGYGISRQGVYEAKRKGADLMISVDCGITAIEEVELARSLGIDTIVTDHHEPGTELPGAVAVLDPKRTDCSYPFDELAGVGVAYKLAQAILIHQGLEEKQLDDYLDLVALGSTADIVPLWDENRILVKHGLERMAVSNNPGLRALIDLVGLSDRKIRTGHVVFILAPRINAGGRMGDARRGVRLLITEDEQQAINIANILEAENRRRKNIDDITFEQALEMIERDVDLDRDRAIVLASSNWHPGVIGIVASRIVEKFYRPTVLIAIDAQVGRGSARSIDGFDLYTALKRCRNTLLSFGGHKYAAGLTIEENMIDGFRDALNRVAQEMLTGDDLVPKVRIDGQIRLGGIDNRLLKILELFAPFGPQNMRPVLVSRDVQVVGIPRVVGSNHLKFKVRQDGKVLEAIGFEMGELLYRATPGEQIDLAYVLEENEWQGRRRIQLRVKDLK